MWDLFCPESRKRSSLGELMITHWSFSGYDELIIYKCWSCKLICWSSLGNIRVSDLFAEVDKIAEAGKAGWQGGQILSVLGTDPNPTHGHLHPPLPLAGNSKQSTFLKAGAWSKYFQACIWFAIADMERDLEGAPNSRSATALCESCNGELDIGFWHFKEKNATFTF